MRKSIFFSVLMLFALSVSVAAQKQKTIKTPEEVAKKLTDKMVKTMNITDKATQDEIYQINLDAENQLYTIKKEIREKYPKKAERKANKATIKSTYGSKRKAIKKSRRTSIKALKGVSKEQWKAWKKWNKERRAERKAKRAEQEK